MYYPLSLWSISDLWFWTVLASLFFLCDLLPYIKYLDFELQRKGDLEFTVSFTQLKLG